MSKDFISLSVAPYKLILDKFHIEYISKHSIVSITKWRECPIEEDVTLMKLCDGTAYIVNEPVESVLIRISE